MRGFMADWIFDLGVSDGQDTAYYLAKGFSVVGVEADPAMCDQLRSRFTTEIEAGRFHLLNNAASSKSGEMIEIHVHQAHQGISGINIRPEPGGYLHYLVETIDWTTLCDKYDVPRYMKIDIEGSEGQFLVGMHANEIRPEFVSIEAYQVGPIVALSNLGYTRFKMIDQTAGFRLPSEQREGTPVENPDFTHASGPFGLDVFGDGIWENFDQVTETWKACSAEFHRTWFDCHAWHPN
jgi:FkbM family methyltransferase